MFGSRHIKHYYIEDYTYILHWLDPFVDQLLALIMILFKLYLVTSSSYIITILVLSTTPNIGVLYI